MIEVEHMQFSAYLIENPLFRALHWEGGSFSAINHHQNQVETRLLLKLSDY